MPDGLRKLPDHVVAPLLRALMTIPYRPESQLRLKQAEYGRPPGYDQKRDYNVLFRGRPVGRIWHFDRYDDPRRKGPWHWDVRDDPPRKGLWGSSPTLESAMADFRRTWDAMEPNVSQMRWP